MDANNGDSLSKLDTNVNFSTKTLQDYEVLSVIGNGTFGTCFKVRDKVTGCMYAWKGMDYDELSDNQRASLISEIEVLRQLQHPNIVQYYHHLINSEAKSVFIVMECCEGGDLAQLIAKAKHENKRFEERYIWRILFQICRALQVCHNKIKEGTILHRDIKPANIFLDANGNAKLGDFGLARVLRRNENFAESFVGTPYYMSPEVIMGMKYDRKSDVWAVGCLVYEMCSLQPPFRGRKLPQLSANISLGKFNNIPSIYSNDLQDIIGFMLVVESDRRPSIEVISRHPVVVRNINDLGNEFPTLIDVDLDNSEQLKKQVSRKLQYSELTDFSNSVMCEKAHLIEKADNGRNISGVFTPDLKAELFYSARRKIFPLGKFQLSDPELYESVRRPEYAVIDDSECTPQQQRKQHNKNDKNPALLTQEIFENALRDRLRCIRAHESLLRQKEEDLLKREQLLNEKEQRLIKLEENLIKTRKELNVESIPPPIPPRKPKSHDDTYCSIESNEISLLHEPTITKLHVNAFPSVPKLTASSRKVTFQSPKKFITYNTEAEGAIINHNNGQMQMSTSSKTSEDSSENVHTANTTRHRRKSFLSILGLSRNNKDNQSSSSSKLDKSIGQDSNKAIITNKSALKKSKPINDENIVTKCQAPDFGNIWTKENKRAAFELLAAMNATGNASNRYKDSRNRIRQSLRERNSLQRNHLRRSYIIPHVSNNQRDHIIV